MLNSSRSMKGASTHWKRLWSKLKDFRRKRISWIQSSLLAEWKSSQKPIIDLHHLLTNLKHGFFIKIKKRDNLINNPIPKTSFLIALNNQLICEKKLWKNQKLEPFLFIKRLANFYKIYKWSSKFWTYAQCRICAKGFKSYRNHSGQKPHRRQ
jgi:hypothetical protein